MVVSGAAGRYAEHGPLGQRKDVQMMKHRTIAGIVVVAAAMALSACSSSSNSASSGPSTTTSHSSATTASPSKTTAAPSGGGGSFCTALVNEQASSAKLGTSFGQSVASGNFATAQQSLKNVFSQVSQDLTKVQSTMGNAPANVQAALKVFLTWFQQVQTAVSNATSLQELGQAFTSLGNDAQLKAASSTLGAYVTSQCGNITSTT